MNQLKLCEKERKTSQNKCNHMNFGVSKQCFITEGTLVQTLRDQYYIQMWLSKSHICKTEKRKIIPLEDDEKKKKRKKPNDQFKYQQ